MKNDDLSGWPVSKIIEEFMPMYLDGRLLKRMSIINASFGFILIVGIYFNFIPKSILWFDAFLFILMPIVGFVIFFTFISYNRGFIVGIVSLISQIIIAFLPWHNIFIGLILKINQ